MNFRTQTKKRRKKCRGRGLTSLEEEKQKGEGGGVGGEVEGGRESHDAQHLLARKLWNAASQVHFWKKNITNSFLLQHGCSTRRRLLPVAPVMATHLTSWNRHLLMGTLELCHATARF